MYRRVMVLAALIVLLLTLAVIGVPATASQPAQGTAAAGAVRGRVISDGLRVRATASSTAAQVGLLKAATLVTIVGRNQRGTWLAIISDTGIAGWVGSPYIAISQGRLRDVPVMDESTTVNATPSPVGTAGTPVGTENPCPTMEATEAATAAGGVTTEGTPSASGIVRGRVISDGLRVRATASNTAAQIGLLKAAALVTVTGRNQRQTWLVVQSETGLTGWVGSAYIAITEGRLRDVAVMDESTSFSAGAVGTAAATQGTGVVGTENPCPTEEATAAATAGATAGAAGTAAATGVRGRIISDGLRVRATASSTAAQIGLFKAGTVVDVLGRNERGTWLVVRSEAGLTGWVGSPYVAITEGKLTSVPVMDDNTTFSAVATAAP